MAKQTQKPESDPIPLDARISLATSEYVAAAKAAEQASRAAASAKNAFNDAEERHRKAGATAEECRKKMLATIHEAHGISQ